MRLTTRMMVMASVVVVGVALFAGVALANHTHTTGNWWHGLGDGGDADYYVHPFNDARNNGAYVNWIGYHAYVRGGSGKIKRCRCEHNHYNVNTGYRECVYGSTHEWYLHNVNQWYRHNHYHHRFCGA